MDEQGFAVSLPNAPYYEEYVAEMDAKYADEYSWELYAEQGWLRHSERFDPEAQRDLELFDALFPNGYGY
jgi:hypothetical protein